MVNRALWQLTQPPWAIERGEIHYVIKYCGEKLNRYAPITIIPHGGLALISLPVAIKKRCMTFNLLTISTIHPLEPNKQLFDASRTAIVMRDWYSFTDPHSIITPPMW